MATKTCGPMYLEAVTKYGTTPEAFSAFAAGFISGQAEKIHLGVCAAAMFRPSAEHYEMVRVIVNDVCSRYGLTYRRLETSIGRELWISPASRMQSIEELEFIGENTPNWHKQRAALCGIPVEFVDLKFHEREGWGQRCD